MFQKQSSDEIVSEVVLERNNKVGGNGIIANEVSQMKKSCSECALFPPWLKADCSACPLRTYISFGCVPVQLLNLANEETAIIF